jgi:hypothetical protein
MSPGSLHGAVSLSTLCPTNNSSDPFHSTIASFEPGVYQLLHFTFHSLANRTFLSEAFAPSAIIRTRKIIRHEASMRKRLSECVGDAALMYSTLAYSASLCGWVGGSISSRAPPEYFVGKALAAVRLRLQQVPQEESFDRWLLMSLYSLAATEFWSSIPLLWSNCPERFEAMKTRAEHGSSMQGVRIHLNALVRLVNTHGGWGNMDPYLLESSILVAKFIALSERGTPAIEMSWDPGPNPPLEVVQSSTSTSYCNPPWFPQAMGRGFCNAAINPSLLGVILDIAAYIETALLCWSNDTFVTEEAESWLFRRLQALVYRLLSLNNLDRKLDECVRLATLVFLLNNTEHRGPQISARLLLPYLQNSLLEADSIPHGLRFWCMCTGALVARSSSPERNWYLNMASECAEAMDLELTAKVLECRLGEFLYIRSRQQAGLNELIEKLIEKRSC